MLFVGVKNQIFKLARNQILNYNSWKIKLLQIHQKLTIVGLILLVATYIIYNNHEIDQSEIGFNYAYITGISMLIVFITSFVLFSKDRIKESKSKK